MKMFGTDGVRGIPGVAPMDRLSVRRLGAAAHSSRHLGSRPLEHGQALVTFAGRNTMSSLIQTMPKSMRDTMLALAIEHYGAGRFDGAQTILDGLKQREKCDYSQLSGLGCLPLSCTREGSVWLA